jgi:hypothetical protein
MIRRRVLAFHPQNPQTVVGSKRWDFEGENLQGETTYYLLYSTF